MYLTCGNEVDFNLLLNSDLFLIPISQAFSRFSDTTFVWKYEKPEDKDEFAAGMDNVILREWLPQNDLLGTPSLSPLLSLSLSIHSLPLQKTIESVDSSLMQERDHFSKLHPGSLFHLVPFLNIVLKREIFSSRSSLR